MHPLRIGILGSGKGSNGRAILEAISAGQLRAEARLIVSDVASAGILELGREFNVPSIHLPPGKFRTRLDPEQEERLVKMLLDSQVELVVLAGFMRVLKEPLLKAFPRRIINIHPSLLPKYPGVESWRQALAAGETVTGCTVHYVDPGIDTGEIIAQCEVPILPDDTPQSLHARIQIAEHALYPRVLSDLAEALGH
ncbi:MAG: phosphoribosylglycinamide formyltransferase [Chthoniobacterales bacterium]